MQRLTAEVEVGDDDEKIRQDDGDGDHEDKDRLHESLQRGLLHAATLSSCIPPPALRCFYPSPSSQSSRYQVPGSSQSSHWSTFGFCTFAFFVMYFPKTTSYPRKEISEALGKWVLDTEIVSSRILVYNWCHRVTVNFEKLIIYIITIINLICISTKIKIFWVIIK